MTKLKGRKAAHEPDTIKEQDAILQQLIDHAHLQTKLYEAYADAYPRTGEFWHAMAEDEHGCAEALEAVREILHAGTNLLNPKKFPADRARLLAEWLTNAVREARRKKITLRRALERALACEQAVLDAGFFKETHAAGPVFRELAVQRTHGTRDHISRLQRAQQLLEQHRRSA